MFITRTSRALIAALPLMTVALPALAEIKDYEFRLTQSEFKQGNGVVITVRLIDKRSGKPVPDAVIFSKRLDMAPENMATMTTPLEPVENNEPGVYRFKTKLTMDGRWQLSVAAKLQGESGTLQGRLIIKAVP